MGSIPVPTKPQKVRLVDLRSDTLTMPTPEMRQLMANARCGDDVYCEDPSINELQDYTAKLFGKEAGLFFPSGTMSNLAGILAHCPDRGSEVVLGDESHVHMFELGGISALGSLHSRTVHNREDGTFSIDDLENKIRDPNGLFQPRTGVVVVENTHNRCGGCVMPMDFIDQVYRVTKSRGVKLHMDGARIFNAAAYLDLPASELCKNFDSVSVCLSKGLRAPVGSVLVGDQDFIRKARTVRKMLGGGMRQAGIIAAAGLHCIKTYPQKLKEDHEHAHRLAQAIKLAGSEVITLDSMPQTNMAYMSVDESKMTTKEFMAKLEQIGDDEVDQEEVTKVKAMNIYGKKLRMVTYQGVTDEDIDAACVKLRSAIESCEKYLS